MLNVAAWRTVGNWPLRLDVEKDGEKNVEKNGEKNVEKNGEKNGEKKEAK